MVKKSGKLHVHYLGKHAGPVKCGDCRKPLNGVKRVRPSKMSKVPKRCRKVYRAYGGSRCHSCVKDRILRAFLIEEQKLVKKVLEEKKTLQAQEAKKDSGKKKKSKK